jgi:ribonuclease E
MAKRMLIDAAHPEEIRVAVIKGHRLEDFDFETATKKQLKGNIYLAKVTRVEPSLQAAFVDYGGNRHGFLAFNEIHPDYYRIPIADREALLEQEKALAERSTEGNGAERAEGEELEIIGGDDMEEVSPRRFRPPRPYKIQEVTKRRQIMLVQVVKEERGNKGAALTTYLSLAGRYCVLMPNTPRGGGISRKITNLKDRRRLKSILEEFEVPDGMSVIVRTAGMERSKAEIKRDLEYLMRLWDEIRELTLKSTAPALIYEEASLIKRAIRDLYDRDIDEIEVEGDDGYRAAKDFMRMLTPSHAKRVHQYKDDLIPLFHRYQVEGQIDAIHSPVVNLKSGGYIVITPTEALVSVDVNSGRATKERNIEETALRTNMEAAEEIARQLRLRDLAGLIVIDFIDMEEPRNNASVERKLKDAMRVDRARIQLGRISAFGLLELSRQRLRPSLVEATMQHCAHCTGSGWVRSIESTALHVMRGLEEEGIRQRSAELRLTVPTPVALYLLNQKRAAIADIERRYRFGVLIDTDDKLIQPAYRLERIKAAEAGVPVTAPVSTESLAARVSPAEAEAEAEAMEDEDERAEAEAESGAKEHRHEVRPPRGEQPSAGGEAPGGEGRRRRRRRRRRRPGREGQERGAGMPPSEGAFVPHEELPAFAIGPSAVTAIEAGEAVEASEPMPAEAMATEAPEGEERPRRARGRRGGRRRRRGERPAGEMPASQGPLLEALPTGEEEAFAVTVPASDAYDSRDEPDVLPAVTEPIEAIEPAPETAAEVVPRRRSRRPRAHEPAAEAPMEAAAAEAPVPGHPRFDFAPAETPESASREAEETATEATPPAPEPEPVRFTGRAEPIAAGASAEPAPQAEPQAPAIPVITVGEGSEEQLPKKRGWWKRLTE